MVTRRGEEGVDGDGLEVVCAGGGGRMGLVLGVECGLLFK